MLDLVIPDTGPLITFALVDRLDLLDRFNCPIVVTDMIHIARDPFERRRAGHDWQAEYDQRPNASG